MVTIQQLAKLAGTTPRTLRHYDAIGLLVPTRDANGYRRYSKRDVERLQLILFYRSLDFSLETIHTLLESDTDRAHILTTQVSALREKAAYFATLAETAEATLASLQGGVQMEDEALFKGLSFDELKAHEAKHETEVKSRWSDSDAYATSQKRSHGRSKDDWEALSQQQVDLVKPLIDLFTAGVSVEDERVQTAVEANHAFINDHFYDCSLDMFSGLGQMYVADARFTAFYDKYAPGLAVYYNDAIQHYCITNS
ncbi:MerR family transcriptional regulator [Exiguobacterium aurantiacum]|uniref:HTH-type transcriptional activator tipA n=1 Tax=Exiguobacterium aurantiacum TaxID=33987 RepID=A0A377FRI7_9BACL|nr:MerR family transcriptional regulator [Exiguobacterium aurantiacum]STO07075.1 HTH-type transcriptional activator tipA [Exiguobacterium aurantiacum]